MIKAKTPRAPNITPAPLARSTRAKPQAEEHSTHEEREEVLSRRNRKPMFGFTQNTELTYTVQGCWKGCPPLSLSLSAHARETGQIETILHICIGCGCLNDDVSIYVQEQRAPSLVRRASGILSSKPQRRKPSLLRPKTVPSVKEMSSSERLWSNCSSHPLRGKIFWRQSTIPKFICYEHMRRASKAHY